MSSNIDLRVVKTKQAIESAFVQLLTEKQYSSITIQNILDLAHINRKTFYSHYRDKCDLADQLLAQALNIGSELILSQSTSPPPLSAISYFHQSAVNCDQLNKYRKLLLAVWDVQTETTNFKQSLDAAVGKQYRNHLSRLNQSTEGIELQERLFASIITCTLKYLLDTGISVQPRSTYGEFVKVYKVLDDVSRA